jgi:hypothetical protein
MSKRRPARARPAAAGLLLLALLGCGGAGPDGTPDAGSAPSTSDAGPATSPDGTPTRVACTSHLGTGLTTAFGRLDGFLVAVLPPGHQGCPSDTDHVHLQVRMAGETYDIAITAVDTNGVSVAFLEKDLALPGGAWSEGWHPDVHLDYVQLGLHDADFTPTPKADLARAVEVALQQANHVSIFATGYGDRTGAHKVHRNGFGTDGALIIAPTAATSHALLFHFATQRF